MADLVRQRLTQPTHPFRTWATGVALVPAAILLSMPLVHGIEWIVARAGGPSEFIVGSMNGMVPLAFLAGFVVSGRATPLAPGPWVAKGMLLVAPLVALAFPAMLAPVVISNDVR